MNSGNSNTAIKFAAVVSHPIQHFAPMFRDLAQIANLEVKVFYCCDWGVHEYQDPGFNERVEWDIPLLDGYDYEFLANPKRPQSLSFSEVDNPDVHEKLREYNPDAVWIHGYSHKTSWRVWLWARRNVQSIYFGDSELLHHRPLLSRLIKRLILPFFFRSIDTFITIGDNNEAYYRHYGVPDGKMVRGAFPIDVRRFRKVLEEIKPDERKRILRNFGLDPDAITVLFVGKFIDIKCPFDLVKAIAKLKDHEPRIQALFVGSGELREQIVECIQRLKVEDQIKLSGFINQSEIPKVLYAGDILAMCSIKDPHPLAVSESMAVGNVIVASDRIGCVGPTDAARPGLNALVYPCGDVNKLSQAIANLADDRNLREGMSAASLDLAWTQDNQATVAAVVQAINAFRSKNDQEKTSIVLSTAK